jgi:hypothetical protein
MKNKLVAEIVKHLPGWQVVKDQDAEWASDIIHPATGAGVFIRTSGMKGGKGYASVKVPRSVDGGYMSVKDWLRDSKFDGSINFSLTKDPKKIAADIERRLITDWLPLFAEITKLADERTARRNSRNEIAKRLAKMIGDTPSESSPEKFSRYKNGGAYLTEGYVRHDGESVDLEFRDVPVDMAEKILKLVYKGRV